MLYLPDLFAEALREPPGVITYHVSRELKAWMPGLGMVEGEDSDFRFAAFVEAGQCTARRLDEVHAQMGARWSSEQGTRLDPRNAWYEVEWQGHSIDLVLMASQDWCWPYHWILAETEEVARRFHEAVCSFAPELTGEILIFDGGRFLESRRMHDGLGPSHAGNLVLPPRFKADLFDDARRFFGSKATYDRMNVPWKRGLLLLGPPGNGKTHAIKALVQEVGHPCLYAKTFKSEDFIEASSIRRVFERARRMAPCLLVLEDLDTLITAENRAFFLNEMDGFAANTGILTIATTNHPAALDPAILERPSRFDRKYHFALPGAAERLAFIAQWGDTLAGEIRLDPEARAAIADQTEGFSFAYLKELFLASTLRWVADPSPFGELVLGQVEALRDQVKSTEAARQAP